MILAKVILATMIRATFIGIVALTTVISGFASEVLASDATKLVGDWRVVRMVEKGKEIAFPAGVSMAMNFQINPHRWQIVVDTDGEKTTESGTWTLRGVELTTQTDDARKITNIRVNFKGATLELLRNDGSLTLERQHN